MNFNQVCGCHTPLLCFLLLLYTVHVFMTMPTFTLPHPFSTSVQIAIVHILGTLELGMAVQKAQKQG